jgi:hypothetical protein
VSAGTCAESIASATVRLNVATIVPLQVWQFVGEVESATPVASVPAVPGNAVPVAVPVHVICSEVGAMELPLVPPIEAPVIVTEAPPLFALVLRNEPETVAVFEHETMPETCVVIAHVMFDPELYATASVASALAVTWTATF